MPYWVYILQSEASGHYYVGHTNDLDDRLRLHNEGRTEVNKGRGPWQLLYQKEFPTRQAVVARERAIKNQKSRSYNERLCARHPVG
jgi:putative endonuclease